MQEADAEINVVGVVIRGGVGGLEVEERFRGLGRAVMLAVLVYIPRRGTFRKARIFLQSYADLVLSELRGIYAK